MNNLLLMSTAWGPKFGGINAFNMDFAKGLASFLGKDGAVFCSVFSATPEDICEAKNAGVNLFSIEEKLIAAAMTLHGHIKLLSA